MEEEAVRVIKGLPDFTPAGYYGIPGRQRRSIPIMFHLPWY
jgi:hypothetical protein